MNETTAITTITTTSKVIIAEITTTSTTTQSHEVILPTVYTPLTSRASSTDYIDQEHTQSFTVPIFTPLPTESSSATYDPDATLPPSYHPLSSKAPRMLTSSSTAWPTSTSLATDQQQQQSDSLSLGQLAGIIIGSILGGLLLLYIFYVLCWTRRQILRNKKEMASTADDNDEKYTASLHLPYDFSYPIHQDDPFYNPDESIASHETVKDVNKPFYYYY